MPLAVLALLVVLLIVVSSVSSSRQETIADLDELRIGILPSENIEHLTTRYTPLFEYLSDEIGVSSGPAHTKSSIWRDLEQHSQDKPCVGTTVWQRKPA